MITNTIFRFLISLSTNGVSEIINLVVILLNKHFFHSETLIIFFVTIFLRLKTVSLQKHDFLKLFVYPSLVSPVVGKGLQIFYFILFIILIYLLYIIFY